MLQQQKRELEELVGALQLERDALLCYRADLERERDSFAHCRADAENWKKHCTLAADNIGRMQVSCQPLVLVVPLLKMQPTGKLRQHYLWILYFSACPKGMLICQ